VWTNTTSCTTKRASPFALPYTREYGSPKPNSPPQRVLSRLSSSVLSGSESPKPFPLSLSLSHILCSHTKENSIPLFVSPPLCLCNCVSLFVVCIVCFTIEATKEQSKTLKDISGFKVLQRYGLLGFLWFCVFYTGC
jgi:hypothetical protein